MKIDRLIGILSILLQREKVTAPYLAETFEVSRRTINRDIEDICKAGIPLVTSRGPGGGISIMEGYSMDRTLITSGEMEAILAGLKSLDSVSESARYRLLMDKLALGKQDMISSDSGILINLSSWYRQSLAPKIHLIQEAIETRRHIQFSYYSPMGETSRRIEPYLLVFQWSSWYVWGFCLMRQDFRLFKLNRMVDLECCKETFDKRILPPYENEADRPFPVKFLVKARCKPSIKWRIVDEFGPETLEELPDGDFMFTTGYSDKKNLLCWILSLGDQIELLEPRELRGELAESGRRICEIYGQTGTNIQT